MSDALQATSGGGLGAWLKSLAVDGSSMDPRKRRRVYLLVAGLVLAMIWIPVALFLALAPVNYTSRWSLILPGAGTGTAVNLESIGQASSLASSPFAGNSVDPKVNYKSIAISAPVLAQAARLVDMDSEQFGKPAIKLVDQTALINFRVSGATGGEAQAKSVALYKALQVQVDRLREDEMAGRERVARQTLELFSDKLNRAQEELVAFQAEAGIISVEQFNELTLIVERLRQQRADLQARLQGVRARLSLLQGQLGMNPAVVRTALRLQQDAEFQQLLEERARFAAELSEQRAKWGRKHYELLATQARYDGFTRTLAERASAVSPGSRVPLEELVIIGARAAQEAPVRAMIELMTEESGLSAELVALDDEIGRRETRLETSSPDAVQLDDLKRKQQVAMAVFTTALARTDLGKSDTYASYPMIQMLAEPTRPDSPDMLGRALAVAGGMAGSFFSLTGLWLLWIRKPLLRRILKSA